MKGRKQEMSDRVDKLRERAEQRISEAEERISQRLSKVEPSGRGSSVAAPGFSIAADQRVDLSRGRPLQVLDQLMEHSFEPGRHLSGSMTAYPTTFCETKREYLEPLLASMPLPDQQREGILAAIENADGAEAPGPLQSLGMHIPGVGCFINGWYMGRDAGVAPCDLFGTPAGFAQIVNTAAHEKWGHGFISELTAMGAEKSSVQLGMHHLADQFTSRTVDTPDHARLSEQWAILFHSSQYVEEGFATWVERYLAEAMSEQAPDYREELLKAPIFAPDRLAIQLADAPEGGDCAQALTALFRNQSPSMESIHTSMLHLAETADALGGRFAMIAGMPAPYAVGFCMAHAIALRHGPKCVPYAVATACNLEYGLGHIANHDLQDYVGGHPELNANTRFAALMFLGPGEPNDVAGFLERAHAELGLTPPRR